MIRVHHLDNSRSFRVPWLLEELGQRYEVVRHAPDPVTGEAPADLRAIHPLGKAPLVEVGGRVLAESGAIIETLTERFDLERRLSPPGYPLDNDERLRFRYWLHYAEGSVMPPLFLGEMFERMNNAPLPFFARPIVRGIAQRALKGFVGPQRQLHLDYMETALAKQSWFAGERFTAADIQMSHAVEAAMANGHAKDQPKLASFLERIRLRPAWRRAMERCKPSAKAA